MEILAFGILFIVVMGAAFFAGIAVAEDESDVANVFFIVVLVSGLIIVVIFGDLYQLKQEVKKLVPTLTEKQLDTVGTHIKEIYKEWKLEQYEENLTKEIFNERK